MPKKGRFSKDLVPELSFDVSVGVHILLAVEQSSLESQSRGCAEIPILTVYTRKPSGTLGGGRRAPVDAHNPLSLPPPRRPILRCYQSGDRV